MAEMRESNKEKITTLECMECGYREVFTERQFKFTDGLRCYKCKGLVRPAITRPGEPVMNRRMKPPKGGTGESNNSLSFKLDMDVSDALKGLKAVQREARKAIKLLDELEEKQKRSMLLPVRGDRG